MVYFIKSDKDGNDLNKARFVAKGYLQIKGINYDETFPPTVHMNSVRMITQIATQNNLDIHQKDFKSAYFNVPIDCDIYVQQSKGSKVESNNGENLVWRLKKSLYGLKQSRRIWKILYMLILLKVGMKDKKKWTMFVFQPWHFHPSMVWWPTYCCQTRCHWICQKNFHKNAWDERLRWNCFVSWYWVWCWCC